MNEDFINSIDPEDRYIFSDPEKESLELFKETIKEEKSLFGKIKELATRFLN